MWLLAACAPDPVPGGDVDGSAPAASPGGFVWAWADGGVTTARLDGRALEPAWRPGADDLHGIWRVPADARPGPATLWVGTDDDAVDVPVWIGAPWFVDVAAEVGLDRPQSVTGWPAGCAHSLTGVALGDLDLDGDLDAIVGDLTAPARLYENVAGPGVLPAFVDRGEAWGFRGHDLVASVSIADWDDDGDPDVFLGRRGANRLLENRAGAAGRQLVDVTAFVGLTARQQRTTAAGWGDFDADGDLDLYEANHSWCFAAGGDEPRNEDHLWRNDDGVFTEITHLLPRRRAGYGFVALWLDLDGDLDLDLLVGNDTVPGGARNAVYRNDGPDGQGGWRFGDGCDATGLCPERDRSGKAPNVMGAAVADWNADGRPDFAMSNVGPNLLFTSGRAVPAWTEGAVAAGAARELLPWGGESITWAVAAVDVDNDADADLLYAGGPLRGVDAQPHALLENVGDGRFVDRSWDAGLASPAPGYAAAEADLDGDGGVDWVVATWAGPPEVWRNVVAARTGHHWLEVELEGDGRAVTRDAFGSTVTLTPADGPAQTCWRTPRPSMSASGDPACHFGLGPSTGPVTVEVGWTDGASRTVVVEEVDRRVTVGYEP